MPERLSAPAARPAPALGRRRRPPSRPRPGLASASALAVALCCAPTRGAGLSQPEVVGRAHLGVAQNVVGFGDAREGRLDAREEFGVGLAAEAVGVEAPGEGVVGALDLGGRGGAAHAEHVVVCAPGRARKERVECGERVGLFLAPAPRGAVGGRGGGAASFGSRPAQPGLRDPLGVERGGALSARGPVEESA